MLRSKLFSHKQGGSGVRGIILCAGYGVRSQRLFLFSLILLCEFNTFEFSRVGYGPHPSTPTPKGNWQNRRTANNLTETGLRDPFIFYPGLFGFFSRLNKIQPCTACREKPYPSLKIRICVDICFQVTSYIKILK